MMMMMKMKFMHANKLSICLACLIIYSKFYLHFFWHSNTFTIWNEHWCFYMHIIRLTEEFFFLVYFNFDPKKKPKTTNKRTNEQKISVVMIEVVEVTWMFLFSFSLIRWFFFCLFCLFLSLQIHIYTGWYYHYRWRRWWHVIIIIIIFHHHIHQVNVKKKIFFSFHFNLCHGFSH